MLWIWVITVLPVLFLTVLFGGEYFFRRRHIDMDGVPPINRLVYSTSKYLIIAVWVAMVLQSWGLRQSFMDPSEILESLSIALWIVGFALLFTGRFSVGMSFRIGSPKERTGLKVTELFKLSRNPMYLGVFTTLLAALLYTLNPLIVVIVMYIIVIHHLIVLAEEEYLKKAFGEEYLVYCRRVRRYISIRGSSGI